VGSILPKDIADGSFTRRVPSSNDKLLVQLLGAKKAKAHIAAQQDAARPNASVRAQCHGKPTAVKRDESDEEEEGRAAAFKSKKRRRATEKEVDRDIDSDDEDEEMRAKRLAAKREAVKNRDSDASLSEHKQPDEEPKALGSRLEEPDADSETPKSPPRKTKAKPKSFLDEILAERSKKKSKKSQA